MDDVTGRQLERRNRIVLAVAAYAYEIEHKPTMSDTQFDVRAMLIRPTMATWETRYTTAEICRVMMLDNFWKSEFNPSTGLWIYKHPEFELVGRTYRKWYAAH